MDGTSSKMDGLMHSLNSIIVDDVDLNNTRELFYSKSYANKRARQGMFPALALF